jgi:hypothetical protein
MKDVWVQEVDGGGITVYIVYVDGKPYDQMVLRKRPRLTFTQMDDIAKGYREGLGK